MVWQTQHAYLEPFDSHGYKAQRHQLSLSEHGFLHTQDGGEGSVGRGGFVPDIV